MYNLKGKLIPEDDSIFHGKIFNDLTASGEVVFNTGMTGYQEILTDPSYCRQIVTLTEIKIPCLYDVDTRAITKKIRAAGTMKIENKNAPLVVAMDFGVKKHILESLNNLCCKVLVVPTNTSAEKILEMNPDGVFLSNSPGDPKDVPEVIDEIKKLIGKNPIFGICLGHQLLALAMGADTYKLKFGHRGSNQPVKNLRTGRIYITSQNHGYTVDEKSLENLPLEVTIFQ